MAEYKKLVTYYLKSGNTIKVRCESVEPTGSTYPCDAYDLKNTDKLAYMGGENIEAVTVEDIPKLVVNYKPKK